LKPIEQTILDTQTATADRADYDRFEREAAGWIQQERSLRRADQEHGREHSDYDLNRIESNVIEVYRRLIRFPDPCPECHRSGRDHDGECGNWQWESPDRSPWASK
jgi:hypothetical protein